MIGIIVSRSCAALRRACSPLGRRHGHRLAALVAAWLAASVLTACGGSDGRGDDTLAAPQPIRRCEGCVPGRLSGHVYLAGLRGGVRLQVHDAAGAVVETRADDQGRFDVDVTRLAPPLLVQAEVPTGGRLQRLHAAVRGDDIGVHAMAVTPLTELMAADALGGHPADLLQAGRAEMQRLESAVRAAERRVAQMVRPVLDTAGVAADVDLRTTALPGEVALQQALAAITVAAAGDGGVYAVRHLAVAPSQALRVAPGHAGAERVRAGADDGGAGDREAALAVAAGLAALPVVQQRLDQLAALYALDMPSAAALAPWLAADFHHAGLDAAAFIETVLRRHDAAAAGGFSLLQLRFDSLQLLQVADGGRRLRLGLRIVARAPHAPRDEQLWLVQGADGRWLLQGDGDAARVRVRNVAVLGPRALSAAALRSLAGVNCVAAAGVLTDDAREQCRVEGGQGDVAAGGWLDFGGPEDSHFGQLAFYRSQDGDALQRLAAYATQSRQLAEPSAQIRRYLGFELDARQVDTRAVRATVTGPGLPAEGVVLHPPQREAGAPLLEHWTLDADGQQDWHAVETGACAAADTACAAAWAGLGTGSGYRFALYDAAGKLIQTLEAALPSAPPAADTLWTEREQWFARWTLQERSTDALTLASLLRGAAGGGAGTAGATGDALHLAQRWAAPQGRDVRALRIDAHWHRAALPPAAAQPTLTHRRWWVDGAGALDETWPSSGQHRTLWLSLLLQSGDALGNHYWHAVSPRNPY